MVVIVDIEVAKKWTGPGMGSRDTMCSEICAGVESADRSHFVHECAVYD